MYDFQTVRDVVNFAVSLEKVSQEFYAQLAEDVTDPGVRDFLMQMVREETIHEEQLNTLLADNAADLTDSVDSAEINAYVQAMEVPARLDYKKAVQVARDKEKASQMLYTILAKTAKPDYLRRLLKLLAKQEQKHREFFAREYDRICLGEN
ncbi:MAG: ferritin family protein [Chitinivibrionales bacterium]|nr:ferritin family protein [Chitinivibrionales bacterium]